MKDCHASNRHFNEEIGLADKAAGREKLWQVVSIDYRFKQSGKIVR